MGTFRLAWRYLTYHKIRSTILVLCIALVGALPLAVQVLIARYEVTLTDRAAKTPLAVGAPGSRFDLLLHALYFRGGLERSLSLADAEAIGAQAMGLAIPISLQHTARGYPLVGTTLDYFDYRQLEVESGTLPLLLGDVVLGAEVAKELELAVGGRILSDSGRLYDIGSTYPLRMHVSGVLEPNGTPDDRAVFTDLRTEWVVAGLGHGHEELGEDADPAFVLERDSKTVTANAAVREFNEITPENRDSFHFHGTSDQWPVSAILIVPTDRRAGTILKARMETDPNLQPIVPSLVLDETFDLVFRVKKFFDANTLLVTVATALFLDLAVALGWKIRERERETLHKIGAPRSIIAKLTLIELGIVVFSGGALAVCVVWVTVEVAGSRWGF